MYKHIYICVYIYIYIYAYTYIYIYCVCQLTRGSMVFNPSPTFGKSVDIPRPGPGPTECSIVQRFAVIVVHIAPIGEAQMRKEFDV